MKSTRFSMRIALALLAIFAASVPAFADLSGTLGLKGVVAPNVSVAVTSLTGFDNLSMLAGVTDFPIATIKEISNSKGGYTLSISSARGYKLSQGTTGAYVTGGDSVIYTLKYDTVSVDQTTQILTDVSGKTVAAGVTKTLTITFASTDNLNADNYTDTLTFTIAGK